MPIPFLDLQSQYQSIKPEIDAAIKEVLDTSQYVTGPITQRFEDAFATYCGTTECVGVSTGTAALELLLRAYGIGAGDEVITVANSFFATAEAIALVNATPVLVDCNETDALIDVTKIEAAITPNTRAIIPVHLYGQCANMDAIMAIAKQHDLIVIEDACQAHGAMYKGKRAGSIGHAAAFSFYPGKNLGAYGEAGAVTTNDAQVAARVRMLRDHGMPRKYHHDVIGRNDRPDAIQTAVLSAKLPHLDGWNAKRRAHAKLYRQLLATMQTVRLFETHDDQAHNYHLFVIRIPNRDSVQKKLADKGIASGIHYPIPIHRQKAFVDQWGERSFPVSEQLSSDILSLPMHAEMTEAQVREVCVALGIVLAQ